MAIFVYTNSAGNLVSELKNKLNNHQITSWCIDSDEDFSYCLSPWECRAWFRAQVEDEKQRVCFGIIESKHHRMSKLLYGVYHGRFAEMLLSHFDEYIEKIEIAALLDPRYDIYNKNR